MDRYRIHIKCRPFLRRPCTEVLMKTSKNVVFALNVVFYSVGRVRTTEVLDKAEEQMKKCRICILCRLLLREQSPFF